MSLIGKTNEEKVWNFLASKGLSAYGVAGLMGNLKVESALDPRNLQNTYERKLDLTDAEYTAAVDSGSYTDFVHDSAGYGLAQWTHWSRKEALLAYVRAAGASIGDLEAQLGFLCEELSQRYGTVWDALKTATSVQEASDIVLTKYERPANQSDSEKAKRAGYGQTYFDRYAKNATTGKDGGTMATKITTAAQLAARAVEVAKSYKTLYIMGCFGAPMNSKNKNRYCSNHSYNRQAKRTAMIKAASPDTFGFDCVCLIKGLLWGWEGDTDKTYGGAVYRSNGVPDVGADTMFKSCKEQSTDFSNIEVGEAVWMDGHIGVYVGDGLAVECTPKWDNCVQITACNCTKSGYNRRDWTKHGKLPYGLKYTGQTEAPAENQETTKQESSTGTGGISVGDVVTFSGSKHYTNAKAASGRTCKPGKARVTAIRKGAAHPFHLVAVSGGGSNVYGWVDAVDVEENGTASTGSTTSSTVKAVPAKYRSASLSGTYKTTADLNMRTGAGTDKQIMLTIPKGKSVKCWGFYNKDRSGTIWLYVVYDGKPGYCSSKYMKKG